MNRKLMMAALAVTLAGAGPASARPYLMLAADPTGFKALDLGDIHQEGIDTAQITLISAPLAGEPFGDRIAALKKERVEFDCLGTRWRVVSISYADAHDVLLASEPSEGAQTWQTSADDPLLPAARDAACLRRYKQTLVSRDLNIGDIVANYHKAWGSAAREPMTENELLKRGYDANH